MPPTPLALSWPVIGAAVIGLIIRLLKSERVPTPFDRIPPKMRPLFALALGAIQAAIETIATGVPWQTALINGVTAACLAVFGHQAVIEGLRDGKEILQTTPPIEVPPAERVPVDAPAPSDDTTPPSPRDTDLP